MRKTLFLIASLTLAAWSDVRATTVTFGAVPTARTVTAADGVTTITTGLVWAGNFTSEIFTFNPLISIDANIAAITLAGGWERLGVDTVADTTNSGVTLPGLTISGTGKVGTSLTDNNSGATKADYFNNKALYLWIFNATTTAAATQMGIFHATSATQAWNFAVNANGVGDTITYSTTIAAAPTIVATASVGSVGSSGNGTLQLVATVPEPSVLALSGFAGVGMLAARRRKRRQ